LSQKITGGEIVARFAQVEHMMREPSAFLFKVLCGADVHVPVDLERVAGHNFTAEPFGQRRSEGGLA
jgi:hypothetical protein